MITTIRQVRKCEDCGQPFPIDGAPDGCFACEAERRREAARAERDRIEAEARARLGPEPLTRSLCFARIGLDSAAESIATALRYAGEGEKATALRRAAEAVLDAMTELERARDWSPPQFFGAP